MRPAENRRQTSGTTRSQCLDNVCHCSAFRGRIADKKKKKNPPFHLVHVVRCSCLQVGVASSHHWEHLWLLMSSSLCGCAAWWPLNSSNPAFALALLPPNNIPPFPSSKHKHPLTRRTRCFIATCEGFFVFHWFWETKPFAHCSPCCFYFFLFRFCFRDLEQEVLKQSGGSWAGRWWMFIVQKRTVQP